MPLRQAGPPAQFHSETIGSLIRHRWLADEDVTIGSLAEELKERDDIPVVAIVDGRGTLLGILSTNHLLSALGRPYGWDVYRRRSVLEWLEPVQSLSQNDPLYLITERLSLEQDSPAMNYYAVVDPDNHFLGLFSQQDLILYLSKQTQRDLKLAQELQGQLVENRWELNHPPVHSEGLCEMFKGVGGDFLAVRRLSDDRWFGCLCDVSGKGIAASLVTTLLWGVLEAVDLGQPLETTVRKINCAVLRAFRSEKFVSGIFWTFDATTALLRFADMGHSHEMLWVHQALEFLGDSPNLPLGIEEDLEIVVGERRLAQGDGLFAYSDGVVENVWKVKTDFPLQETMAEILGSGLLPTSSLVDQVRTRLTAFRKVHPAHDDMSMVWFRLAAGPPDNPLVSIPGSPPED